jgi:hypothetical protein
MRDELSLEPPKRREKCHASVTNRQGWLTTTTFALCHGHPCQVEGAGTHRVILTNESPLQYYLQVEGRCVTDNLVYLAPDGQEQDTWKPNRVHIDGRRKSRVEIRRQVDRNLKALQASDDESIEISVSWECVTHRDIDRLDAPLVIQVDTRPAAG